MNPDLDRLIRLQETENAIDAARRKIAEMPQRREAFERRVGEKTAALQTARDRLSQSQTARRSVEKDVAAAQGRLSKYKDQLMEVKTNKEYQAMQKEIATAEREVRTLEDKILEHLLEADELTAAVKKAESELAAEQAAVKGEEQALERERVELERESQLLSAERSRLAVETGPDHYGLFERLLLRQGRGIAVVEAKGGLCTFCHVRLRPQVFNEVRRNDSIIQCESCYRILYFVPTAMAGAR